MTSSSSASIQSSPNFGGHQIPFLCTKPLLIVKLPPRDRLTSQSQVKMCQVRCRHYQCGHWFHENVKPCAYFNEILDNAHKNPDLLTAQECKNHKKKISWCGPVVEEIEKDREPSMIRIKDIKGPWFVARRNIVGGHCATKELRFLPSNDPGGRSKYAQLGYPCKECRDRAEAERKNKGLMGRFFG